MDGDSGGRRREKKWVWKESGWLGEVNKTSWRRRYETINEDKKKFKRSNGLLFFWFIKN